MNNTVMRALDILELISKSDTPLSITNISSSLNIPKSSTFDIVHTLSDRGFIEPSEENDKLFRIGLQAYQIGMAYTTNVSLFKISHPILENLKECLNETAYLAVENKGYITYLDKVESDSPIRSTCTVGARNFMHITGLGKAILAGYPDDKVYKLTKGKFITRTPNTIRSLKQLRIELKEIRSRGYSIDNGEDISIVRCVAAPIRNGSGEVIAAISVSMLSDSFPSKKALAAEEVVKSAMLISAKMGYTGNTLY